MTNINLPFGFARILDSWSRGEYRAQPGIVTEFSNKLIPQVSVQPVFERLMDGDDAPQKLPPIPNVPVLYPGGIDYQIDFDVPVDSQVLLIVSDRSLAAWQQTGQAGDPELDHVSDITDAIAIPGLIPAIGVLPTAIEANTITMRKRDGTAIIQIKGADVNLITTGTVTTNGGAETKLQDGSDWAIQYTAMKAAFDQMKNELNALVSAYNAHIHITTATVGASPTLGTIAITTSTGTPPTADMSSSKVSDVRVP